MSKITIELELATPKLNLDLVRQSGRIFMTVRSLWRELALLPVLEARSSEF